MEHLLATPIAYIGVFVLGALFGSFANVCIYRLPPTDEHPEGRSIATPGSHCFACQEPVAWYDNIPLLSFVWLRGRCRWCGTQFSARYLFVEAATAMLFLAVYELCLHDIYVDQPIDTRLIRAGIYMLFVFTLVVITFIDMDTFLILNVITYPAVLAFYGLAQLLPENRWSEGLIGAAVGYGVVRIIADGYALLRGRQGMGYGDGKLLAVIGALLGWKAVVFSLFAGSLIGTVFNLPGLIRRRHRGETGEDYIGHEEIPFGPALATAAVIFLFLEPWLEIQLRPLAG